MKSFPTGYSMCMTALCLTGAVLGCSGDKLADPQGAGAAATQQGGGGASSSGASGATQPGIDVPSRGPGFLGAGTMGAGAPITAEPSPNSCGATAAGTPSTAAPETASCFFATDGSTTVMAVVERMVEVVQNEQVVHVRLTLNPGFVDNTYGTTAVGWGPDGDAGTSVNDPAPPAPGPGAGPAPDPKKAEAGPGNPPPPPKPKKPGKGGHTFEDLVGSDKAEFQLSDASGNKVMDFYVDYISVDTGKPSGYGCLGVTGGEGKMLTGSASDVVAATTSLDRDLNACGYSSYIEDSPATDANYTPNPATPGWDYRVVYDVWVKASAFGSAGFGDAQITYVHASPSKSSDTLPVTRKPCPPGGGGNGQPGGGGGAGGAGGAGGGTEDDGHGGHGGEPDSTFDCLADGKECVTSLDCCSGVCCNGICGASGCVK